MHFPVHHLSQNKTTQAKAESTEKESPSDGNKGVTGGLRGLLGLIVEVRASVLTHQVRLHTEDLDITWKESEWRQKGMVIMTKWLVT